MIELKPVEGSTQILAIGHDAGQRVLAIRYRGGKVYHYRDVPDEIVAAFMAAESKGKFAAQHIKGFYDFSVASDETKAEEAAAE